MTFSKRKIAEFKAKGRHYLSWRKNLKPSLLKKYFHNDNVIRTLNGFFPDKNIECCHMDMYDIVVGDYQFGLKYVNEKGTFYMFWAANSFWAYPQDVAVGKAVNGKIYLISEHFPNGEHTLNFKVVPEEYVNKNEKGFRPRSYSNGIFVMPHRIDKVIEEITDEDVRCIKIAYEGVRAFSNLIEESF